MGYHVNAAQCRRLSKHAIMAIWSVLFILGASIPAKAHSFNVALVLSTSDTATSEGRQFRDGFMLATTERDAHPDMESDGHLGGLDVYVSIIAVEEKLPADIARQIERDEIDIVIPFLPESSVMKIGALLAGQRALLLQPGRSPFSQTAQGAVAAFRLSFEKSYGRPPGPAAGQGYNAARRIDQAVRLQEGVGDRAALRRSFVDSRQSFNW